MKKKLLLVGISSVIIVTFLEVTLYFMYIFKPIDRILGRDLQIPKGIPTNSEILTPPLFGRYFTQADESKRIFPQRINDFTGEVELVMQSKSSFMKTVEASYAIAGTVVGIETIKNADLDINPGYKITLKNSTGDSYTVLINPPEAQYAQVFLRTISSDRYSSLEKHLTDIKTDDYLVVRRSANLLNPAEVNIVIDILRTIE